MTEDEIAREIAIDYFRDVGETLLKADDLTDIALNTFAPFVQRLFDEECGLVVSGHEVYK